MFSWPFTGGVESKSHDAPHTVASEDVCVRGNLPVLTYVRSPTVAGIFSLAVFSDEQPVEVRRVANDSGLCEASDGPYVGIEL